MALAAGWRLRDASSTLLTWPGNYLAITGKRSLEATRQFWITPHFCGGSPCRQSPGKRLQNPGVGPRGEFRNQFLRTAFLFCFGKPANPRQLFLKKAGQHIGSIPGKVTEQAGGQTHAFLPGCETLVAGQNQILFIPSL